MNFPHQDLKQKLLKPLRLLCGCSVGFALALTLIIAFPTLTNNPIFTILFVLLFLGVPLSACILLVSFIWFGIIKPREQKDLSTDSTCAQSGDLTESYVPSSASREPMSSCGNSMPPAKKVCARCGRGGFLRRLDRNGLCKSCAAEVAQTHENVLEKLADLEQALSNKQKTYNELKENALADALEQAQQSLQDIELRRSTAEAELLEMNAKAQLAREEANNREKSAQAAIRKVQRSKEIVKAIQYALDMFNSADCSVNAINATPLLKEISDFLQPTVELDLQCLTMRDLRKRYRENEKRIEETLQRYEGRYTTKANVAIYKLMVIALRAELQNILYNIRFGKLEDALTDVKKVTAKYYTIAADGNQNIAPTLKKFIGEIEYLFIEAIRIEYEYYVQKERAREEQRAIREQMRQEAAEQRELERQQKQVEKEESKFHDQIQQLQEQLSRADNEKSRLLEDRIAELQLQLAAVAEKKDRIANLQNGKAGNVYIISNIGSFGEDVFKVGMTRRLEPQERVDELGSASVPFPFDVHSMIFSDDAPALETHLHHLLNDRRVNKVNLRKEFFHISLDELEAMVAEVAPTAEFKRTALAEQYRQSLSIDKVSDSNIEENDDDDSDDIGLNDED